MRSHFVMWWIVFIVRESEREFTLNNVDMNVSYSMCVRWKQRWNRQTADKGKREREWGKKINVSCLLTCFRFVYIGWLLSDNIHRTILIHNQNKVARTSSAKHEFAYYSMPGRLTNWLTVWLAFEILLHDIYAIQETEYGYKRFKKDKWLFADFGVVTFRVIFYTAHSYGGNHCFQTNNELDTTNNNNNWLAALTVTNSEEHLSISKGREKNDVECNKQKSQIKISMFANFFQLN